MSTACSALLCLVLYALMITLITIFDATNQLYFRHYLNMSEKNARMIHLAMHYDHIFILISGYLADTYMDSYSTVFIGTIISFFGLIIMTVSQFSFMDLPKPAFFVIFGSVASIGRMFTLGNILCLGMDQFEYPFKYKYLTKFMFLIFWLRTLIIDVVQMPVTYITNNHVGCFSKFSCISIVFYLMIACNGLMVILLICFNKLIRRIGTCRYLFIREAFYCAWFACVEKRNMQAEQRLASWLQYAVPLYGEDFVTHVSRMHVFILMLPMFCVFGQLTTIKQWDMIFHQLTITKGEYELHAMVKHCVSVCVNLFLLPIVIYISYYIGNCISMFRTELRKIMYSLLIYLAVIGGLWLFVHEKEKLVIKKPSAMQCHLRIYNPTNDVLKLTAHFVSGKIDFNADIEPRSYFQDLGLVVDDRIILHYSFTCGKLNGSGTFSLETQDVKSYYLSRDGIMRSFYDDAEASPGRVKFRTIPYAPNSNEKIVYSYADGNKEFTVSINEQTVITTDYPTLSMYIKNKFIADCMFHKGGVYVVLLTQVGHDFHSKVLAVNPPIAMEFYYFVPIFIMHCISDSIFFTYFYAFIYEQAPPPIKRFSIGVFYFIWRVSCIVYGGVIDFNLQTKMMVFSVSSGFSVALFSLLTIWFDYKDTSEDCEPDQIVYTGNIFLY